MSHQSITSTAAETISTLTDDSGLYINYKSKYLKAVPDTVTIASKKLNFSTRRLTAIIQLLLPDAELQKVREVNKRKLEKGEDVRAKLENAAECTELFVVILKRFRVITPFPFLGFFTLFLRLDGLCVRFVSLTF